jgi:hypothetical protein
MAKDAPEGWEWSRIQVAPCPQCGQNPSALAVPALGAVALSESAAWGDFLVSADGAYLRTSPGPEVWTPAQYGAHVRDMLRVFGDRILAALIEDNPNVSWFDPGEEGWESYNRMPPADIAEDIDTQAHRFAGIVEATTETDWARTVMRDGVDSFTVAGLACFGVHEAHHHLLDANGELTLMLAGG